MWLPWVRKGAATIRDAGCMREGPDRRPDPVTVAAQLFHYSSPDEDSARWWDFPFRRGDIVISTRSKSGTTWVQMICLLLVFQSADLPGGLDGLSPWLDFLIVSKQEVFARLAAQTHRRVIKTHTPLDGVPLDERATYVVVGRHPLDTAVSLYHHSDNIDRRRIAELTGQPETPRPPRPRCTSGCGVSSIGTATRGSGSTRCPEPCSTCPMPGPAATGPTSCSCTTTTS